MPLSSLDLLETLASGRDFRTGERLPTDHLLNDPDVIRTLHWSLQIISKSLAKKTDLAAQAPPHQGEAWSKDEEELLKSSFHKAISMAELAKAHGRSRGSIVARLKKLQLIHN